jgi:Fic family protein
VRKLQIISTNLIKNFKQEVKISVKKCFDEMTEKDFTVEDFKNYMLAGAVASAQIEGSTLDLNSFYRSKQNKTNKKQVTEIENLLTAYEYARQYELTEDNLLKCHKVLAKAFTNITKKQKGEYRQTKVGINSWHGLVYLAVEPQFVHTEMAKLFKDTNDLRQQNLSLKDVLYYASCIHYVFAKIHPFADGNGRVARLLEKWFLAKSLGEVAWSIPTEKFYYDNRQTYYANLNIGVNYYESLEKIDQILPFLLLLPKAVCYKPVD